MPGRDPHTQHIIRTFQQAINHVDDSEPPIRNMIENDLMDVAGINRTKVSDAVTAGTNLAKKIAAVRKEHIKKAFRHLRDNLPRDEDPIDENAPEKSPEEKIKADEKAAEPLGIHGHSLSKWAKAIFHQDAGRIHTAISVGLTAGEDNTDIAHRVIGSRRNNGSDGMTEITRQHIFRLGKGLLQRRKSRMSGAASDV